MPSPTDPNERQRRTAVLSRPLKQAACPVTPIDVFDVSGAEAVGVSKRPRNQGSANQRLFTETVLISQPDLPIQ